MAGPRTELAKECSISAKAMGNKAGHRAIKRALAMIAAIAAAPAARLLRTASTNAPPGTWPSIAATVPALSATPIAPWVHPTPVK